MLKVASNRLFVVFGAGALALAGCGGGATPVDGGGLPDAGRDGAATDLGGSDLGGGDLGTDAGSSDLGTDAGGSDLGADGSTSDGGALCGNGTVDTGETCDLAIAPGTTGECPVTCNDADPCTTDTTMGSACTMACTHTAITASGTTADTCCPTGATTATDVDCGTPPTAFRVVTARLIAPRVIQNIFGCSDLTDTGLLGGTVPSLNMALMDQITMSTAGVYDLSIVSVFRPLVPAATATTPLDLVMAASCTTATPPVCSLPSTGAAAVSTTATNMVTGTCLAPVASEVNGSCTGSGACMATYSPTANSIMGPCFSTDETDITLAFVVSGTTVRVTLHHARVAATYLNSPVDQLVPAVVVGFLSEREAADIVVDIPNPLGGTIRRALYELLQAGGATTTNSSGATVSSSCNNGGAGVEDDRDTYGTGTSAVRGFNFYLNATLDLATWSGP